MDLLIAQGKVTHQFRRSWIAFFRIIDDEAQFRPLDRWIRRQFLGIFGKLTGSVFVIRK